MEILLSAATSLGHGALFCLKLLAILLPLLVGYEMAAAAGRLKGESAPVRRLLGALKLSPESGTPLLAGLALGIAYGAGFLIAASRERRLSPREVLALCLFLCTCHALPEDTLLFSLAALPLGFGPAARLFFTVVAIRLVLGVVIVRAASRFVLPRLEPSEPPAPNPAL